MKKTLIQTREQQLVWDRLTELIENEVCDGISAEGHYSEFVHSGQKKFIDGMRQARLSAINALRKDDDNEI